MLRFSKIFKQMLDILLPRQEREVRIDDFLPEDVPVVVEDHEFEGVRITTLMRYRNKAAEDLIRALKYDGSEHAATLLAGALADYLRDEIAQHKAFSGKPIVIAPIPLYEARERERGFNQVEMVLNQLPKEFTDGTIAHVAHVLARTRETVPQTKLSRAERLKNVQGAFALAFRNLVEDAHVILVDDVTTTGATLTEARKALLPYAAGVTLLALARA